MAVKPALVQSMLTLTTAVAALALSACAAQTIDQNSSCRDYLKLPESSRLSTINRVAVAVGNQGAIGSPIFQAQVDNACQSSPDERFGMVLYAQRGY